MNEDHETNLRPVAKKSARPDKRAYWHRRSIPVPLGCRNCAHYNECGGLGTERMNFDCLDYCCAKPDSCDVCCPRNPQFSAYYREVGGFSLRDLSPIPARPKLWLPSMVPLVVHPYSREKRIEWEYVAVRLPDLISLKDGRLLYQSKQALASKFNFNPEARLVISGVALDKYIEAFWQYFEVADLPGALRRLDPYLVTTPNYSLFLETPRTDDLHSIKRIALVWRSLSLGGVRTALHINARTEKDWDRWIEFVCDNPGCDVISFEFATGAKNRQRAEWHVEHLKKLADECRRPLQLVTRAGKHYARELREVFGQVCVIDSDAFMKAINRKSAQPKLSGGIEWTTVTTPDGDPIDDLLENNVRVLRHQP